MADSADLEVLEGFLCPICMMDLVTPTRLHSHFHEKHSEDLRVSKFVKGFMGQAKKMLKQTKNGDDNLQKDNPIYTLEIYNEEQSIGSRRNHTEEFKTIRNKRMEGYAMETNKILIRLDKLLLNMPTDPSKRKVHEQTTVAWLDGTDVARCPNCAKTFHIVRRRHHCRLCGSIMCHDCSCFLSFDKARQLLAGTYDLSKTITEDEINEEESLRLCEYCLNMVESRGRMQAARNADSTINELYNNLRENIAQIEEHAELYEKMSLSLNDGKSKYNLADAQQFWVKILKSAEKIEAQSSKIATLNINNDISPRQLQLQKSVRMGVTDYIKGKILLLPKLPSEEEYAELQERRRKRVEERIKEEKEEVSADILGNSQFQQERVTYKRSPVKAKSQNVKVNDGWIPENTNSSYNENPLIEQMNNIRNYIKQAREALKFDEVASLEQHLKELNEEYFRQSQALSPNDDEN